MVRESDKKDDLRIEDGQRIGKKGIRQNKKKENEADRSGREADDVLVFGLAQQRRQRPQVDVELGHLRLRQRRHRRPVVQVVADAKSK